MKPQIKGDTMKKATIAFVLAVVVFAATSAFAQGNFALRADVPFGFSADGKHYAAGSYLLRTINSSTVLVSNIKTGEAGMFRRISPEQAKAGGSIAGPVLRFAVNGERAYLTSLTDGDGNGWHVRIAKQDLEASRGPQSQTIIVALR